MALRRGEEDVMVWVGTREGVFSVKSMYGLLLGGEGLSFPWRGVWRSLCPLRVSFAALSLCARAVVTYSLYCEFSVGYASTCC